MMTSGAVPLSMPMPPSSTSSSSSSNKSSSSAVARKLSILVGICGSLVLLSSTTSDSLLRDARSTILPRLLAAVTDAVADDAANDEEDGATTSVPIDEDAEAPLNLTSTYQNHAERMAERRLASPAPPSSDIVPNEYIVGINPWAYAYNFPVSGTGTCYMHGGAQPEVKGTFYARDGSSRCYRVEIGQGGNKIRQTTDGRSAAACSGTTGPSTSGYDKTVGTLRTRYSNNIYYTGGNDCYPLNPFKDYNRRGRVYLYYDTSLGPSEYRAVASEPSECNYRINIYLPSCLLDSMWTYRHSTYGGVQQATDLIGKVGGSINQVFQYSLHGFSATMTSTQAAQMLKEQVVAYVEPSYVVHSRSINNGGQGIVPGSPLRRGNVDAMDDEARRRLAIPMFNVKEPAAHWGLERLSSRGGKNGKYLYFHIGEKTHLYLFDTAINENHDEFWPFDRFGNATERHICIGSPDDYLSNVHGTHVASLAAGMNYGTARNGTIHPVQVLDATGKGTTTSVLCGVEWLINDQLQYNYANEVDPITNEGTGPRKSIASITWGTNGRSDILDMAIGNLAKVGGVPAVVAAGNDGANACNYSPYDPTAIMIASLDDSAMPYNARSSFSNYGSCIDFFAPGADILGAGNEGTTSQYTASGTSVAAAIATGVGALYLDEINPRNVKYSLDVGSIPAELKVKIDRRAYRNAVTNLGAGSPNVMVTGTATVCKGNHHCRPGDFCYFGFCKS